jgi:hypothetical protein
MTFNIGNITINAGFQTSYNTLGLSALLELQRRPAWSLTAEIQPLFPFIIHLEIGGKL